MITFKKLRFKNFKSFGNSWNEIDFNGERLVAVLGKNGQGKCLDKNTVITIRSMDQTVMDELVNFINKNKHRCNP